jgi:hypothetical protein
MSPFEFYFGFFGLIMGLAAVTLASGLADALKSRKAVRIGVLTPLLALFMLIDISTFWAIGWESQDVEISYATIYWGLAVSLTYFLGASLVFPRDPSEWPSLNDYYDGHKRLPLAAVWITNAVGGITTVTLTSEGYAPATILRLSLFFGAIVALMMIRNRRANIVLLILLILINLTPAFVPSLGSVTR